MNYTLLVCRYSSGYWLDIDSFPAVFWWRRRYSQGTWIQKPSGQVNC